MPSTCSNNSRSVQRHKAEVGWLTSLLGGYTMLGPFSISTYMPFFPALTVSMGATHVELQQTLSVYLAAFGFMMLLHGPLSDAFGRRPVILAGLGLYLLASIGGERSHRRTRLCFASAI